MLQIVTEFCLLLQTPRNILFSAVKSMQKILADDTCVCVYSNSIQVQMNHWKIVWLPVWIKSEILLEVVFRVHQLLHYNCHQVNAQ